MYEKYYDTKGKRSESRCKLACKRIFDPNILLLDNHKSWARTIYNQMRDVRFGVHPAFDYNVYLKVLYIIQQRKGYPAVLQILPVVQFEEDVSYPLYTCIL